MHMKRSMYHREGGARQRGLSLVELMVGITVGLFVVAAAATLVANQLSDNRRLLLETQVQQDLRATMDIITRAVSSPKRNTRFNELRMKACESWPRSARTPPAGYASRA